LTSRVRYGKLKAKKGVENFIALRIYESAASRRSAASILGHRKKTIRKLADDYYVALFRGVRKTLRGVPGAASNLDMLSISATKGDLPLSPVWPALAASTLTRKKITSSTPTSFWRDSGKLWNVVKPVVSLDKASVVVTHEFKGVTRKGSFKYDINISTANKLPRPFDNLIVKSFFRGTPIKGQGTAPFGESKTPSIMRVLWVEQYAKKGSRPFIAALSAKLGTNLVAEIFKNK